MGRVGALASMNNLSGKEDAKLKVRPRCDSCVHKGNKIRLQGTYSAMPINVTQNFLRVSPQKNKMGEGDGVGN